jgi:hypothetical protein
MCAYVFHILVALSAVALAKAGWFFLFGFAELAFGSVLVSFAFQK